MPCIDCRVGQEAQFQVRVRELCLGNYWVIEEEKKLAAESLSWPDIENLEQVLV